MPSSLPLLACIQHGSEAGLLVIGPCCTLHTTVVRHKAVYEEQCLLQTLFCRRRSIISFLAHQQKPIIESSFLAHQLKQPIEISFLAHQKKPIIALSFLAHQLKPTIDSSFLAHQLKTIIESSFLAHQLKTIIESSFLAIN